MTTNELKKGTKIKLRIGWEAKLEDNKKGNIRTATVYGDFTEIGSVYAHDIMQAEIDGQWVAVEHTAAQKKLRRDVETLF